MKNLTNISFIIFILLFIAFAYFWYQSIASSSGQKPNNDIIEQLGISQEFLETINRLRSIKIDKQFLESDSFRSLKDLTPAIEIPAEIGRPNPFLPLQ